MTATNLTAYPRLDTRLTHEELAARYTLKEADEAFVRASSSGETANPLDGSVIDAISKAGIKVIMDTFLVARDPQTGRPDLILILEMRQYNQVASFHEHPIPELNSELIDFRAVTPPRHKA